MSLRLPRVARSRMAYSVLQLPVGRRFLAHHALSWKSGATHNTFPYARRLAQFGTIGCGLAAAQCYLGTGQSFFEHKFSTTKSPEDLADFYGTEDFMEVFCVLPFMVDFMMRGAEFDDEGNIHAWGLLGPGELEVNIDFDEREIDIDGDGVPDTLVWFNKKEHFHDVAPSFLGGFTLWEMTQNFGYHRMDDGTCEIYHHGEKFEGLFPIRLLFQLHARYVIWATERYINSDAFGSEDREDDLEEQRQNIPLHVFKHFLEDLTRGVEQAKEDSKSDVAKQEELTVTLRRLETISTNMEVSKSVAHLRTLTSRKTKVSHAHLVVEDQEIKDTIRSAMQQIGSTEGQRHKPSLEMGKMVRRATIDERKNIHSEGSDQH